MSNPLIEARDAFARQWPEARVTLNTRDWGVIDTGGTGPVLLLLPGTLGRSDIFWNQISGLEGVRVLSVSYPDQGGVTEWVQDLASLLDQRAVSQVAVLGSSLGGYVAQAFAARYPERTTHLFAANTLASTDGIAERPPYSLDIWNTDIALLRGGFAAAMQAWGQEHPEQADLVSFLMAESAARIPDGEMRARLAALKDASALPPDPRPMAQTTIIESGDDPLLPAPIRQGVQNRLAGAPVFHFAKGGHFPYILRPALYTGLLQARLGLGDMPAAFSEGIA